MTGVKLSSRLATLNESATLALNARAKSLASEGKTIYNLTAGELSTNTPEYIQKAVADNLDKNKYTPVAGMLLLREAIANHAKEFYSLKWIRPENVVVTSGAKPALYATFLALINPGDEVIVPVPAWVSYMDLIRLAGGVVVESPLTEDYDLDVKGIKKLITPKTKAILVNSPHNPTGAVFSKRSLEELSAALSGLDITLIADDIYSRLVFGDDFSPVPSFGFDRLVIINGFSKSQALTGWRIGYLIADRDISDAATALLSHITGNAPLPSQYAAIAALNQSDKPPAATLKDLNNNKNIATAALSDIERLKHNIPGGAFYIFLDLRNLTDNSSAWCERLLIDEGVALVPGEAFAAPGFARLTFSGDRETLKNGIKGIKKFVKKGHHI